MPPEFTPGIQSGANFYAGVTIARIKPYMHDRLEKCVLTSSVYEPADFNPCTADPNEECSCFNIMRHFRTHPNATGVIYSTVFINDDYIVAMAIFESEQARDNFNDPPTADGQSLQGADLPPDPSFLDLSWPDGANGETFRSFGGPVAFPIWGATAGQSPICAGPTAGCPQFGRASAPIDNEMDFARFMQIMPSASDALVAQLGLLWTLGIRDEEQGMVVVVSAYDSQEPREPAAPRPPLGQTWWSTVAPMFPTFNCPCAEGHVPNICAENIKD